MLSSGYLVQPGTDEGISWAQLVVYEAQRTIFGRCTEPERELGKFHGQRVEIDTVDALLSDSPFPVCQVGLDNLLGFFRLYAQFHQVKRDIFCDFKGKMSTSTCWVEYVDRKHRLNLLFVALGILDNCL